MKKRYCLKGRGLFNLLFAKGARMKGSNFQLVLLRAGIDGTKEGEYPKIGIMVGRRFGKAHDRNKVKRRIRGILREYLPRIKKGTVFAVRVSDWSRSLNYNETARELEMLLKKSMILEERNI